MPGIVIEAVSPTWRNSVRIVSRGKPAAPVRRCRTCRNGTYHHEQVWHITFNHQGQATISIPQHAEMQALGLLDAPAAPIRTLTVREHPTTRVLSLGTRQAPLPRLPTLARDPQGRWRDTESPRRPR